jgi:hypothetical protein
MPTDLLIGTDLDIEIDETNDLGTVSGIQQLEQSVAIDVLDVTQNFVGSNLSGGRVGLLEQRVQESLENDEQLTEVVDVVLQSYNKDTGTIEMEIIVLENENFVIELENLGDA